MMFLLCCILVFKLNRWSHNFVIVSAGLAVSNLIIVCVKTVKLSVLVYLKLPQMLNGSIICSYVSKDVVFFAKDWMYMMYEINCRCSAGLFNSKKYTAQYVIFNHTLCLLDYFVIGETKNDESFPSQQFAMDNFEVRARKDRDCHGCDLLEFVRKCFICKRQTHLQPNNLECICSELTISNI